MVTRRPWATGLTAITVFVVVDEPSGPRWSAYTHFSPTAMGHSAEPAAAVVPEPPPDVVADGELPGAPGQVTSVHSRPFHGRVRRGRWSATHARKLRPLPPVAAGKAGRPRLVVMSK